MSNFKFLLLCFMEVMLFINIIADEVESSPLIIQQERIQQLIIKLDEKFLLLSELLKVKEPENAKFLLLAFQKSKETLVQLKVESSIKHLKENELQKSIDQQQKILDDLFGILNSLTNLDYTNKDEINKLEKMKRRVEKLIKDEFRIVSETEKIENKDAAAEKYAQIILKLEELIKLSQATLKNTVENRVKGLNHLSGIAKNLERHKNTVEVIFETLAGFPLDAKINKEIPPEDKPIIKEEKNTDVKNSNMEPSLDTLRQAHGSFNSAEKSIIDGKPFSSEKSQKDAIDALIKTLEDLKNERGRILSLPEDYSNEIAKEQEKVKADLEDIEGEKGKSGEKQGNEPIESSDGNAPDKDKEKGSEGQNEEGEKSESSEQSGDSQKDDSKKAKANTPIEKAKKYMEESTKNLNEKKSAKAKENQQKSIEELKKMKAEIEKTLAQLRKEEKEEKLANLASRFVEILNLEKKIREQCLQLDNLRIKNEWTRNEKVKCINLMQEQLEVKELVIRVEDILLEDASTIVFPDIVNQIKGDMVEVSNYFKIENTGLVNQLLIGDIILSLEELVDSLQKAREEAKKEAQEGKEGAGQNNEKNQLISKSAELKLLRKLQTRINQMTKLYSSDSKSLDASDAKKTLNKIYERQLQVLDITKKINERKNE